MTTTLRDRIEGALPCKCPSHYVVDRPHDTACPASYRPAILAIVQGEGKQTGAVFTKGFPEDEPPFVHLSEGDGLEALIVEFINPPEGWDGLDERSTEALKTIAGRAFALGQRSRPAWGEEDLARAHMAAVRAYNAANTNDLRWMMIVVRAVLAAAFPQPPAREKGDDGK